MSYYGDGRDVLDAAYFGCAAFTRYHAHPTAAGLARRARGLVMVLDLTQPAALERFARVCYAFEDAPEWRTYRFDVYDHAGLDDVRAVLSEHGDVQGRGELFGVRKGEVVAALTGEFDGPGFEAFAARLRAA